MAGISRWPHFRVPRDTRGYNRDSVTCIFSSMQGHCDWFVASLAVTVNNQSVLLVATYQYQARLAKDLAAYCGRSFGFEAANKNHLPPPSTNQKIERIVARPYVPCNLALAPLILVNYSVQFYFLVRDMHCCGHVLIMTTPTNITSGCNMNTIADIGVSRSGCNTE